MMYKALNEIVFVLLCNEIKRIKSVEYKNHQKRIK